MANETLKSIRARSTMTPQTEKAAAGQKRNNAGGYTFTVTDIERVKRFLILGSDKTYYETAAKLTKDNAGVIIKMAEKNSRELVDLIVAVSTGGRAPKQQPALFALAIAASVGSVEDKQYALAQLNAVARTGTALFTFVGYALQFRGWGRALRRAVADWYTSKPTSKLAYQMVKYQSREGFSHADLAALSHPALPNDAEFNGLMKWAKNKNVEDQDLPKLVRGFEIAKTADIVDLPELIGKYGLTWEMIPSEALNNQDVWSVLLDGNVPLGALMRQLPRLTRIGLLKPMGLVTREVVARLTDADELKRARLHPLNILIALRTYAGGRSIKGDSTWVPVREIVDAMDEAFYKAFEFVEPTGKRYFQALDISGSMGVPLGGYNITAMEAALAMSMVTLRTEPYTYAVGFQHDIQPMPQLTAKLSLDQAERALPTWRGGGTNVSAAIEHALAKGIEVDTFIIYTDNDVWMGTHPHQSLEKYRRKTGIDAKLIVVAMTASRFTIADPNDPGMLDIAGFDTTVPTVISEFSRGL